MEDRKFIVILSSGQEFTVTAATMHTSASEVYFSDSVDGEMVASFNAGSVECCYLEGKAVRRD